MAGTARPSTNPAFKLADLHLELLTAKRTEVESRESDLRNANADDGSMCGHRKSRFDRRASESNGRDRRAQWTAWDVGLTSGGSESQSDFGFWLSLLAHLLRFCRGHGLFALVVKSCLMGMMRKFRPRGASQDGRIEKPGFARLGTNLPREYVHGSRR